MMNSAKITPFRLILVVVLVGLLIACDPLAPDSAPAVIVITPTLAPTRTPLPVPAQTTSSPEIAGTDVANQTGSGPTAAVPVLATNTMTGSPATESASTEAAAAQACTDAVGQVIDLQFSSKVAGTAIKYRAYLPPCYSQTARRYPYVVLMPGSDGDETEWTNSLRADIAEDRGITVSALPPMILIMTAGGDLMNLNAFPDLPSWETVIVSELIPDVEKNFCTWNAREGRAIGGISRGGFWAFEIAFRHPELFGAIGGHSPFFDPQNSPPAVNPMSLAKTMQFAPGTVPRIWVDIGKDDVNRPNVEVFEKTLAGRNIDPGYTMNPIGDHSVQYWSAHVAEYLSFYGQSWPHDASELPSCLQ